jgi:hypothetical protein
MKQRTTIRFLVLLAFLAAGSAQAQATRTWVSGVGDDANPCSRTAPCKTFAGAISKTAAGGEIDALDPGGFGALTIVKSITIDGGGGQIASVLVAGTNGITVTAGAADVVTLRNLQIQGLAQTTTTPGINGVLLNSARALHIEHCVIQNFGTHGINIVPAAGGQVFIDDTISRGNNGSGLNIVGAATVRVTVSNSRFLDNANGIVSGDYSRTSVRASDASGNAQSGFVALGVGAAATMNIFNSSAANNIGSGILSGGTGSTSSQVRISNVSVSANGSGMTTGANGAIVSFINNYNAGSGAPTSTIPPQ